MKIFITTLALALSTTAFADGFKCEQTDYQVGIKVFNNTDADEGVRNAAIMVLSDLTVSHGRRTIASFTSQKRTLGQRGTVYTSVVDLRVSESNRSGENVLGTKLGHVKQIVVDIDHNYNRPIAHGEETEGTVTVLKRNGDVESFDIVCERYLKN